jgi:8-oxo-dGTP diphosphatase
VTCTSCGTSHWRNPLPCANGVVVKDGRVLLTRRAHAPWLGLWCSPGGFCEYGEHPAEAVVREVLEETGLDVAVDDYLGTWVDVYSDDPGDPEADVINVAYYTVTPTSGARERIDPSEVIEIGWFRFDTVPDGLAPLGTLEEVLVAATSPERSRRR